MAFPTNPVTGQIYRGYEYSAGMWKRWNRKVGFYAYDNPVKHSTTNALHSFETVEFNEGNAYNNATGQFVAPIAGKYFVSASQYADVVAEGSNNYISIQVNGAHRVGGHITAGTSTAHASAIIQLNKDDIVRVTSPGPDVKSSVLRNYFGVHLINAD